MLGLGIMKMEEKYMANETTLEKQSLSVIDLSVIDPMDAAADTATNATEPMQMEQGPYHSHWASVIGAFQDDPMLDVMMANIRQRRREMDADENIA
jgi:hypothetical protein